MNARNFVVLYITNQNTMNKYTVILMAPEFASDGQPDVYKVPIAASNKDEAIEAARSDLRDGSGEVEDVEGLLLIDIFDGHILTSVQ